MNSFEQMLAEAAENVRKRKHIVRDLGLHGRDVAKVVRTRVMGTVTDKQFMAGVGSLDKQIGDENAINGMVEVYEEYTGKRPGRNMVYVPSLVPLGGKCGHPDAWVDSGNARTEILKTAEKNNINLDGRLHREATPEPPKPKVKIAPDIVKRLVRKAKSEDPKLAAKSNRDVADMVTEKHSRR